MTIDTNPTDIAASVLRPYQAVLVGRLRGAYRAGYRAPLLQLATGGGKTHIFTAAIAGARGRLRGMTLSEAEVRAIARERNYKRGWVAHFLREQAARLGGAA